MKFDYTPKIQKIEDILDDFLPDLENSKNDALWQELNFSQLPAGVETKHFNQLVKPCRNLIKLGGKRWRPIFMVLCAELIKNEDVELAYKLTPLVELVHTASLIHDDIEDGADERRHPHQRHLTARYIKHLLVWYNHHRKQAILPVPETHVRPAVDCRHTCIRNCY